MAIDEISFSRKIRFVQTPNEFLDREDLPGMEKLLYIVLCRYAGDKATAFPSKSTLAKKVGCSTRSIRTYLKNLEEKGGLYVIQQYDKATKKQVNNLYYIIDTDYSNGQFDKSLLEPLKIMYPDKKKYIELK